MEGHKWIISIVVIIIIVVVAIIIIAIIVSSATTAVAISGPINDEPTSTGEEGNPLTSKDGKDQLADACAMVATPPPGSLSCSCGG